MRGHRVVLVVEDDRDTNETITDLLTNEGYSCIAAFDGERGVALLEQQRPDLVVLDLLLPDISGVEVLSRQRRISGVAQVPVIVTTAMPSPPKFGVPVVAVLRKPFSLDDLLSLVRRFAPLDKAN